MKRVLILEDDEGRIECFRRNLDGHTIETTKDVEELKILLMSQEWDVLFLDHDLGSEVYCSTERPDTGSEAARWLSENLDRKPKHIIIHTLDEAGRVYMKDLLPDAVCVTAIWTTIQPQDLMDPEFLKIITTVVNK
jgi:CheY-like chemotaxis protein